MIAHIYINLRQIKEYLWTGKSLTMWSSVDDITLNESQSVDDPRQNVSADNERDARQESRKSKREAASPTTRRRFAEVKPPYSYIALITMALESSSSGIGLIHVYLTLHVIYYVWLLYNYASLQYLKWELTSISSLKYNEHCYTCTRLFDSYANVGCLQST